MEQYPASRAPHGRDSRQRSVAPCSPMETPREQAALQRWWMGPCRGWSRDLGLGSASRLRCRFGAALHTHLHRALRYQPQPYVYRVDLALSRSRACHAKRMDGRIASYRGRGHPPGRSSRRARAGASVRGRLRPVPEAGSSIPLAAGAERQVIRVLCWNYLKRKPADVSPWETSFLCIHFAVVPFLWLSRLLPEAPGAPSKEAPK